MWTVLTSSKCTSEFVNKDHKSLLLPFPCSVNMNYLNLNVISVILSTVGRGPNQVTRPWVRYIFQMSAELIFCWSNVLCHIFQMETLVDTVKQRSTFFPSDIIAQQQNSRIWTAFFIYFIYHIAQGFLPLFQQKQHWQGGQWRCFFLLRIPSLRYNG